MIFDLNRFGVRKLASAIRPLWSAEACFRFSEGKLASRNVMFNLPSRQSKLCPPKAEASFRTPHDLQASFRTLNDLHRSTS